MNEPVRYWITRDSDIEGHLSDYVDVWLAMPYRSKLTPKAGAYWLADNFEVSHHGRFSAVSITTSWKHAIPETDIECIRRDTVAVPARAPKPRTRK